MTTDDCTPEACVPGGKISHHLRKTPQPLSVESCFFANWARHTRCSMRFVPVEGNLLRDKASFRKVSVIIKKIAAVLVGMPLLVTALLISVPARSASDDD